MFCPAWESDDSSPEAAYGMKETNARKGSNRENFEAENVQPDSFLAPGRMTSTPYRIRFVLDVFGQRLIRISQYNKTRLTKKWQKM